jgi:hypothetical protein
VGAEAGNDILDVVNGEHDATYPERVRRCVFRFSADRRRPLELHQLNAAVAVRGPHHCDVTSDVVEPDHLVCRRTLDCRLALQLEIKFDKERDRGGEVADNNADVVQPPNRQVPSIAPEVVDLSSSTLEMTRSMTRLARCGRTRSPSRLG